MCVIDVFEERKLIVTTQPNIIVCHQGSKDTFKIGLLKQISRSKIEENHRFAVGTIQKLDNYIKNAIHPKNFPPSVHHRLNPSLQRSAESTIQS